MIVSAHHLTAFWFESAPNGPPDAEQVSASAFLTASVNALRECAPRAGAPRGAINTGFDPPRLNSGLPGYRWLQERLRWMKQTFPDFDDQPGGNLKDPETLRDPFPAFHYDIRYTVGSRQLALDGIRVLVGHDFVVIHEFSIRQESEEGGRAPLRERRFAAQPEPSTALFTASFSQLSGSGTGGCGGDWLADEFARGSGRGVKQSLRWAVRADQRHYSGCVLDDGVETDAELSSQFERHSDATGCFAFLCLLLVKDSKVQYEHRVVDQTLQGLEQRLAVRADDAEELLQAWRERGPQSFSDDSIDGLSNAHLADRKTLDHFDRLVDTCLTNKEKFEQVAPVLMESDNRWTADARKRMSGKNAYLLAAQMELRRQFDSTAATLEELRRISAAARPAVPAQRVDAKLLDLCNRLQDQFKECNDFCLIFASYRLFEPSQEILFDLLQYEIDVPVTSTRDFRSFIIMLHMVFDEGLPESLRRWKPAKAGGVAAVPVGESVCGACGQRRAKPAKPQEPLPAPLTRVAEVLHGDTFGQLTVLRNKFAAHDAFQGDAAKSAQKLSQVYVNLIGDKKMPARYNAAGWLELQKAVLGMLSGVLGEVLQVFVDYENSTRKPRGG